MPFQKLYLLIRGVRIDVLFLALASGARATQATHLPVAAGPLSDSEKIACAASRRSAARVSAKLLWAPTYNFAPVIKQSSVDCTIVGARGADCRAPETRRDAAEEGPGQGQAGRQDQGKDGPDVMMMGVCMRARMPVRMRPHPAPCRPPPGCRGQDLWPEEQEQVQGKTLDDVLLFVGWTVPLWPDAVMNGELLTFGLGLL